MPEEAALLLRMSLPVLYRLGGRSADTDPTEVRVDPVSIHSSFPLAFTSFLRFHTDTSRSLRRKIFCGEFIIPCMTQWRPIRHLFHYQIHLLSYSVMLVGVPASRRRICLIQRRDAGLLTNDQHHRAEHTPCRGASRPYPAEDFRPRCCSLCCTPCYRGGHPV